MDMRTVSDETLLIHGTRLEQAEKAENAWQSPAAIFAMAYRSVLGMSAFRRIEGNRLSYNNWCDLDGALQHLTHVAAGFKLNFDTVPYIAVAVKHGSACGAGIGETEDDALRKMIEGEPEALHGGVVVTNFELSDYGAVMLRQLRSEKPRILAAVAAPSFGQWAPRILARKGGECRMLVNPTLRAEGAARLDRAPRMRYVRGAMLVQSNYTYVLDLSDPALRESMPVDVLTKKDIVLAWAIGSTSRSNTITLVSDGMLIANAVGQQKRSTSAWLAVHIARQAGHNIEGSVAYSDSFFPFTDGPEILIDAGVKTLFATTGSINDAVVSAYLVSRGATSVTLPDAKARGFFGH